MLLVLLLRHAESTSNVGDDVEDPELTLTGVAQADAWRERTASWSLDAILVSPMLRCVATAARALGACNCSRWEVCAAAREHWWVHKQNRGRLAADLLPDLVDLPSHGLSTATIEDAVGAPSEHWDPVDEAKASKRALGRRSAAATLALVNDLCARADRGEDRKIAVVCHWGTIAALSDADAPNAGVVGLAFTPAADRPADPRWSCHRRAAADLGWHWDVVGPFAADAPAIPCVE